MQLTNKTVSSSVSRDDPEPTKLGEHLNCLKNQHKQPSTERQFDMFFPVRPIHAVSGTGKVKIPHQTKHQNPVKL